ncbi:M81 family metallopeptidase [Rhizobium mayense]|uniref:Microcystinase C n=1 Tax=Rhizobium mayense TaxID=1312184 RepID=A0ABT7K3V8_9HYPH|nr:M81 family metallopeptidase [Rhizobium mayense]MDL2403296.1 M81 family metallopeptidase [Rhizobium mayense]
MKRVIAAFWQHETNTFNPHPTTILRFKNRGLMFGGDIARRFSGTETDWGSLIDFSERHDWELITPLHAQAGPSGTVTKEAFEELVGFLLGSLDDEKCDGIFLMLHGSMVSERFEDCEGEILARIRQVAGWNIPVVVTLDPHANVTFRMAELSNAIVAYRTTPHVDQVKTTQLACHLLNDMLLGGPLTKVKLIKPPLLAGLDGARTTTKEGPMPQILDLAERLTQENPAITHISVQAGFSYSDIFEIGPSAAITCHGGTDKYDKEANALSRHMWQTRADRTIEFHSLDKGLAIAESLRGSGKPVILVDYADNPGGGAAGDDVAILRAVLSQATHAVFFSLWAPEAVQACQAAGLDQNVALQLGQKGDLRVTGRVKALASGDYLRKGPYARNTVGNLGMSALVSIGGVDVVLTSIASQTEEREQFKLFGIEFEEQELVICKGMNHFRADLEPLSRALVFVDTGHSCTANYTAIPYQHVRRPIWPLDHFN